MERRKKGKRQREQTRKNEDRRKIEKKRERKKKGKGVRLCHAGLMPTNYECKVMVILISSAKHEKNGRNKTGGNHLSMYCPPLARPSFFVLSIAPAIYIIQNVLSYVPL